MNISVYESSDIFDSVNKEYFPYYGIYKDLLVDTDSALFYCDKCDQPVGIMILRPGADDDTLHISCLEIAEPIQHNGWGSKVISALKSYVNGIYKRITLRCLKPELIRFYQKNGFRIVNNDPKNILMEAYV